MKNRKKRILLNLVITMLLLAVTATPALAAPLKADSLNDIITNITRKIEGIATVVAVLGLTAWGVAQFAAPFAPEINSRFQGYATKVVFGSVLILGASEIVTWLGLT